MFAQRKPPQPVLTVLSLASLLRCLSDKGEDSGECNASKRFYKSICPTEWVRARSCKQAAARRSGHAADGIVVPAASLWEGGQGEKDTPARQVYPFCCFPSAFSCSAAGPGCACFYVVVLCLRQVEKWEELRESGDWYGKY